MPGGHYDVIVIGSGSAGSVIVRRLVDAGASVLLLEAGGPDANPAIHDPARVLELWGSPEDWGYRTAPQSACAGRQLDWPRGRVLGGSSSLHGMIYIRGHRSDYDGWASCGNSGWAWDDVLPLFKRSEDFDRGASEFHGAGGELHVLSLYEPHPVIAAVVAAAEEVGVPANPDHNGAELDGVGLAQLMIKDGRRQNAVASFLAPVLDAPNLTVLTAARARRLLFAGTRCTGVEFACEDRIERAVAAHEVLVCCGTIESPKLLMLSGIGTASELRRLEIDVVADLPGVGDNLHDHAVCPIVYEATRAVPPARPGLQMLHGHLFARSRPELTSPDVQPLFVHRAAIPPGEGELTEGFTLMPGIVRPASRGSLRLASADPDAAPVLDPRYLEAEADLEAMEFAFELCREIGQATSLDGWRKREAFPGPRVRTKAEIREHIRQTLVTYHHQVGTCAMGIDELAVVDPELRVYGIEGLRVADASIMPAVPSGNTHAAATMIGERAADLVLDALAAAPLGRGAEAMERRSQ
jgi:choline dehydrogenase